MYLRIVQLIKFVLDGSAVTNRVWTDCYAQLIGTVLSIWDDRALEEREKRVSQGYGPQKDVPPTFINLTDATMRMVNPPSFRSLINTY